VPPQATNINARISANIGKKEMDIAFIMGDLSVN
jgi:hypothetical protein